MGGHNPKWSSSLHVIYACPSAQAIPWKESVGSHDPSDLLAFTSLVDVWNPELDLEKSSCKVMLASDSSS